MPTANGRRRRRYILWAAVLIFVGLPLFSAAYPFFTNCAVASVLVVNRSGQDIAQAVFLFEDTPVRREALAAGEWEWLAIPATPHGEYVNGGYLRVDVTIADGTRPIDEESEYVGSTISDSHVAEIGPEEVAWDQFSSWLSLGMLPAWEQYVA